MPRPSVSVQSLAPHELDRLDPLWHEVLTVVTNPGMPQRLRERLATCEADVRVLVATSEGHDVGFTVLQQVSGLRWWERPSVLVTVLHVSPRTRHHGVGRALLAGAVSFAEECGTDDVVVEVPGHLREFNRFYARLGFTSSIHRRASSVVALRRRLGLDSREPRVARLVDLRLRQRTLRRRASGAIG